MGTIYTWSSVISVWWASLPHIRNKQTERLRAEIFTTVWDNSFKHCWKSWRWNMQTENLDRSTLPPLLMHYLWANGILIETNIIYCALRRYWTLSQSNP